MPETPPQPTPQPTPPPQPEPPAPQPTPAPQQPPTPPAAPVPPDPQNAPLGEPGLRALQAERDARAAAEREAAAQKHRADELARQQESETDRLKREAEEGKRALEQGVSMARTANLTTALGAMGLAGPKAAAAARLLDGVQYDEATHQPTNLSAAVEAAKARYGPELFAGATPVQPQPAPGATPAAPAGQPVIPGTTIPALPEVNQGPGLTPVPSEDEQFETFMQQHLPHALRPNATPQT